MDTDPENTIMRYYFSMKDTILNYYLATELIDFDHRKEWKLMKTDDDQFIRIQVIDRSSIEVLGPAPRKEDLYDHSGIYTRLPDDADNMPFTDSLLYRYGM